MLDKLLVVTTRNPYPVLGGDAVRLHHICEYLSEYYSIGLAYLRSTPQREGVAIPENVFEEIYEVSPSLIDRVVGPLRAGVRGEPWQFGFFWSRELVRLITTVSHKYDVVLAHLVRSVPFCGFVDGPPVAVEMTDAMSLGYERIGLELGRTPRAYLYRWEADRLARFEGRCMSVCAGISVISERDRRELEKSEHSGCDLRVFGNGIDLESRQFVGPSLEKVVVFIGQMRTIPNRRACQYFMSEILPLVRREDENVIFRIVGDAPRAVAEEFSKLGAEVTGRVDSLADAVRGSAVAVAPMRSGAGVQNKVLDYMALGIPPVVSEIAAEGLKPSVQQEIPIATDAVEFAEWIVRLLRCPNRGRSVARKLRRLIEAEYSWSDQLCGYQDFIAQVSESRRV